MDRQVHLFLPHITVAVHEFVGEKRQCHDAAHLLSMIAIDCEHHVLSIASEYNEDNVTWEGFKLNSLCVEDSAGELGVGHHG